MFGMLLKGNTTVQTSFAGFTTYSTLDDAGGGPPWVNPANAAVDDSVNATCSFGAVTNQVSDYLRGVDALDKVPDYAIGVTQIEYRVKIKKSATDSGGVSNVQFFNRVEDGVRQSDTFDGTVFDTSYVTATKTEAFFTAIAPAQVRGATSGAEVRTLRQSSGGLARDHQIDYFHVRYTYVF